jgi:hypothetical protein
VAGVRNEPLYVNLLLTALARGTAASVVLVEGDRVPDPATLTNDAHDLAWFAEEALDLDAQSAHKVIRLVLEAAGIRHFHLRRTEAQIHASLEAPDGTPSDYTFKVTKLATPEGDARARLEISLA